MNDIIANPVNAIQPQVLRADAARLNITWSGNNGELTDPISFDLTDADIKQMAAEAVRQGSIPGIPADNRVDFTDFIVDRVPRTENQPWNRAFLRPKPPFGQ
jgi:hypothetical protein